jgi:TetR/AcrR family transcriptional regulator
MARPRSAGYEQQRSQILAGAAALFARQGFPGTSMNEVAAACGMSKPTLYHYFADKEALLAEIALDHVGRLTELVAQVQLEAATQGWHAEQRLAEMIARFVLAYADAQHAHRVLTEDVKFLGPGPRQRVQAAERRVVRAFADTVAELRPDLAAPAGNGPGRASLAKPLAMLLFGMINWMFTWMKPGGPLTHAQMAPVVVQLFLGGLQALRADVAAPAGPASRPRPPPAARSVRLEAAEKPVL